MFYAQGEVMVVLCPSHAETIAEDGWSKLHVKEYLYEKARKPVRVVKLGRTLRPRGRAQLLAALGEPDRRGRDGPARAPARARSPSWWRAAPGAHTAFLPGWATPSHRPID